MLEPSYKILKVIESHPEYTQRQIAKELGYSLGKVNYVLSALVGKGIIKLQRFIKSKNKTRYRYVFTPQGIKQRYGIAKAFISKKMNDYDRIAEEINEAKKFLEKF